MTGHGNGVSKCIEFAVSHEKDAPQNPVTEKAGVFRLQVGQHLDHRQHFTAGKVLPNPGEYVISECHLRDAPNIVLGVPRDGQHIIDRCRTAYVISMSWLPSAAAPG